MSVLGMQPDVMAKLILGVSILGGALMCFFGIRLFKIVLGLAGFVVGATVAAYFAVKFTSAAGAGPPAVSYPGFIQVLEAIPGDTVVLVWSIVGGVGGAALAVLVDPAGVFLLGAWLGQMVGEFATVGRAEGSRLMVLAILALIGGVLAMVMRKAITIVSTATIGSCALMFGMYGLLKKLSPHDAVTRLQWGDDTVVLLCCALVLALIGAYVQFTTAPKDKKEDPVYKKVRPKNA